MVRLLNHSLLLSAMSGALAAVQTETPRTTPVTFHMDAASGNDAAAGDSPATAWRSLERVNRAELIPGDRVLFRRGGVWRGTLLPKSGSPQSRITYAAYGEGPKPILQNSAGRAAVDDWEALGSGLWATRRPEYELHDSLLDLRASEWRLHQEGGAQVSVERVDTGATVFYRLTCTASGAAPNHIQFWGPAVPGPIPDLVVVRLRLRCSTVFRPPRLAILRAAAPWHGYASSTSEFCQVGPEWQTVEVVLRRVGEGDLPRLNLYLGGRLPAGATFEFEPIGAWSAVGDEAAALVVDVGNIIFDHGRGCGVKKWRVEDLHQPGDYVYDGAASRVVLRADANPGATYTSIELALRGHIISQSNVHDVTYEGLALRYGAAHGIGGANTARVTVRDCDVSYIGGGHQFTTAEGRPVRFGNGIEFWNAADDHLVEGCRLWEIYDAALTNQGSGVDSRQTNIVYRNNVIWNCEYSFEYWNRPAAAVTENVRFEHNTCVDAGCGWGHMQRPDRNGAHLMFYHNAAATRGLVVRDNVFCNSTEVCFRLDNDWRAGLAVDYNLWYQAEKPLVRFLVKTYYPSAEFERYRREVACDAHSAVGEPRFRDRAALDFRLAEGSPGTSLASDGGSVGARGHE